MQNDYSEDREFVKKGAMVRTMLTILMEECAELQQAASKCIRIFDQDPFAQTVTPAQEAMDSLVEEADDVLMILDALSILPDDITTEDNEKWHRWAQRAKGVMNDGYALEGFGQ